GRGRGRGAADIGRRAEVAGAWVADDAVCHAVGRIARSHSGRGCLVELRRPKSAHRADPSSRSAPTSWRSEIVARGPSDIVSASPPKGVICPEVPNPQGVQESPLDTLSLNPRWPRRLGASCDTSGAERSGLAYSTYSAPSIHAGSLLQFSDAAPQQIQLGIRRRDPEL